MNPAVTFLKKVKLSGKDLMFEIFHSRAIERKCAFLSLNLFRPFDFFFLFSCLFSGTYLVLYLCTLPSTRSHSNNLHHLNTGMSESSSVLTYFYGMKIMGLKDMLNRKRLGIISTVDSSRAIFTHTWLDGHTCHKATQKWCLPLPLESNFRHLKNISVHRILESD